MIIKFRKQGSVLSPQFFSSRYYECDEDVANDFELQNFMNEVSADGEGSEGGLGNVSLSLYNY